MSLIRSLFRRAAGILGVVAVSWSLAAQAEAAAAAPASAPADPRLALRVEGKADAPVTILEFSSYTCPHCADFHAETRPWLVKTFVDTGRAKIVNHDFPLDGLAVGAAMLVHSAPAGTAEALSETLFSEQRQWAMSKDPRASLTTLAGLAGMSKDKVDATFEDQKLFQGILDLRKQAEDQYGIDSTPTLVIGGKKIAANSSREELTAAIEAAEAAAKKKP